MHRTLLVRSVAAIAVVVAVAGCDPQPSSNGSTAAPAPTSSAAPATSSVAPATSSAAPAAEPTNDAATVKTCKEIKKDIADNAGKIAKAEKIGPPAGHYAVSAQWAAGSAAIIAHSIGANDTVSTAAEQVEKEMMNLSDATNESAGAKPSQKKLKAAINELNAACSAA